MANVGKNIRTMRNKKNMTQDDLAEELFVSRQTVSNYETGKSNPDVDTLIKIAEILETDVNILIFGIPTPPDKKREYRRLAVSALITLVLLVVTGVLTPYAKKWQTDMFDPSLHLILLILLRPLLLLSIGWLLMQAVGVCFGAKPLKGKAFAVIHKVIIVVLAVYFVIVIPFCIDSLYAVVQEIRLDSLHTSWSSTEIRHFLPMAWRQLVRWGYWVFTMFHAHFPALYPFHTGFFLLGIALWGTGRKKE